MSKASFIITHGGVGSIISSLKLNKKVIAVPRLSKYNEHVNDHQLQIIEDFDKQGYIIGTKNVLLLFWKNNIHLSKSSIKYKVLNSL